MKKSIFILMAVLAVSVMANAQAKKEETKVKHLTYREFLTKVWNFESNPNVFKYKGKLPAVVDFYADWCGPCRRVAPILEKLAGEYDGRLLIYKVNVSEERDLAAAFQVTNIPTILFIPMEGQPTKLVGAMAEEAYRKNIEAILSKNESTYKEFKDTRASESKALEYKE